MNQSAEMQDVNATTGLPLRGMRVTVMGLGTRGGGLGVARYLVEQGAIVTVTDSKPAEALRASLASLADLPIRYVLGRHEAVDFTPSGAELVIRNPGVDRNTPLLRLARDSGIPVEMEMSLFFRACPAPIIGVTGTKGKTTVATLCAEMLRAWDPATVLAGNMGGSALARLPEIKADTPVVIELSSWQLEALDEHGLAPHIAVLTNISEDHLDHYDGFADYAATKRTVTRHQTQCDTFIVNADDPDAWRAASMTQATVVPFGLVDRGQDGAWSREDRLLWRQQGQERVWDAPATLSLRGAQGRANALAAMAAAMTRGAPPEAVSAGLRSFGGVRDRLEPVATVAGVRFINDTCATAPAATIAALEVLGSEGAIHLIAGGADKRADLSGLAIAIARDVVAVYPLEGSATPALWTLLVEAGITPEGPFASMEAAVNTAAAAARPGDVVLLSPGCASFGIFQDEFDRGAQFRDAVAKFTATVPIGTVAMSMGSG